MNIKKIKKCNNKCFKYKSSSVKIPIKCKDLNKNFNLQEDNLENMKKMLNLKFYLSKRSLIHLRMKLKKNIESFKLWLKSTYLLRKK